MTPEEIKAILRKMMVGMYDRGDLDAAYQYYADSIVFQRAPYPPVVGAVANRQGDESMLAAFTENRVTVHEIVVEGGTAVMHWAWEAVHTGVTPSLGIPPTGKLIKMSGCSVFHWKGNQIVEQWEYSDMLGLLQQLGVIPAMA
jgi:steroid delta-isomerase-like uncharacterized protein